MVITWKYRDEQGGWFRRARLVERQFKWSAFTEGAFAPTSASADQRWSECCRSCNADNIERRLQDQHISTWMLLTFFVGSSSPFHLQHPKVVKRAPSWFQPWLEWVSLLFYPRFLGPQLTLTWGKLPAGSPGMASGIGNLAIFLFGLSSSLSCHHWKLWHGRWLNMLCSSLNWPCWRCWCWGDSRCFGPWRSASWCYVGNNLVELLAWLVQWLVHTCRLPLLHPTCSSPIASSAASAKR